MVRQVHISPPHESAFIPPRAEDQKQGLDLFWKEVLLEGTWKHPTRGFTVKVDKPYLDKLAENFKKQREYEVNIPVPHGHTYEDEKNAGFVNAVAVQKRSDGRHSLWTLLDIKDGTKVGETVKQVSVSLNPSTRISTSDGKVVDLGNCLEHVALTNYEVIKGMSDFIAVDKSEPVAAMCFDAVPDTEQVEEKPAPTKLDQIVLDASTFDAFFKALTAPEPKGESDMPITTEQLRAMEKKFGLEENALTEENWFDELQKVDLSPEEAPQFDITKDPNFVQMKQQYDALQTQNHTLTLDRNQRRLNDVVRRLDDALKVGRINKAAYDKIVSSEESLKFSAEKSHGAEFEQWLASVEKHLDIVESLDIHSAVDTEEHIAFSPENLGQGSQEKKELSDDELAEEAIKFATPQYYRGNNKLDPTTNTFVVQS